MEAINLGCSYCAESAIFFTAMSVRVDIFPYLLRKKCWVLHELVIMHAVIPVTPEKYLYRAAFFSTSPLKVEGCLALHSWYAWRKPDLLSASPLGMENQVLEGGHDLVQHSRTF